jgi:predicted small lipoprotein YifL
MAHLFRIPAVLAVLFAVSGCTGSGPVVEPSSLQPLTSEDTQASGQLPPPSGAEDQNQTGTLFSGGGQPQAPAGNQVAAINTDARVQFAPVIGVSAEAVPTLAARLRARAAQRGVTVAGANDSSTSHVMKGYFSAFTEGGETTVIYVWDVLDPGGNRLHRIQGQQKQPGSSGEGWSSVTAPTMEAIADRSIDELAVWLSSTTG